MLGLVPSIHPNHPCDGAVVWTLGTSPRVTILILIRPVPILYSRFHQQGMVENPISWGIARRYNSAMRVVLLFVIVFAALPAFAQLVERETPPCSEQAIAATRAGAERRDPASLYLLGRYYGTGKCLAGDGDKAIELYWQAAELGYPPAFYNLGMIAAAQGDFKTAEKLFLTGAGVGHRGCELQLGILYHFDIPNMHDDAKAYAWLSLSALRTPEALEHLERVQSRLDTPNRAVAEGMFSYLRSTFEHVPEFKFQQ